MYNIKRKKLRAMKDRSKLLYIIMQSKRRHEYKIIAFTDRLYARCDINFRLMTWSLRTTNHLAK